MTVLATLQHRLRGHTCYEGCEDLLCLAAREIETLTEKVGHLTVEEFRLRQWLCPHRDRMKPDRGNDDGARQCADCAGIILDPERIALERAERAEALMRRQVAWTGDGEGVLEEIEADMRAHLAALDARSKGGES